MNDDDCDDPQELAYRQGRDDFRKGENLRANPYPPEDERYGWWFDGWADAAV